MRSKNRRWVLLGWGSLLLAATALGGAGLVQGAGDHRNATKAPHNETRGVFSPRMDYEQWTPLGMGDPLKNDPTYDYVPPVLERVHYWVDPVIRKSETTPLTLSATETPAPQHKTEILVLGVSSKKPSSTSGVQADSRRDYEPYFKYIDTPKYNLNYQRHVRPPYMMTSYFPSYYTNKNHIPERPFPKRDQGIPYTLLMPPPVPVKNYAPTPIPTMATSSKTQATTVTSLTSDVTVQQSNLIFQSSSVNNGNKWRGEQQDGDSSSHVTWRTPHPNRTSTKRPAESYIHIQQLFSLNETNLVEDVKIQHLSPIVSAQAGMHKGLVTDEAMDIASTYVNIGKPEAQMDSSSLGISGLSVEPPQLLNKRTPIMVQPAPQMILKKTVQPAQVKTYRPAYSLHALLQKEASKTPIQTTTKTTTIPPVQTTLYVTPSTPTTTTTSTLTTDPLFRHYKQPSEPIRGPMYLIIQGHSKVKTYGPVKQIHGINIQETNEIQTSDDKDEYQVKHLHHKKISSVLDKRSNRNGRAYPYNLQSLKHVVQTNLGAIDLDKYENQTVQRRVDKDVKETELVVGYDVSENATTEKYHRGIVEKDELFRHKVTVKT